MTRLLKQWLRCARCYDTLTLHERTKEGGYKCSQCGAEFATRRTMQRLAA